MTGKFWRAMVAIMLVGACDRSTDTGQVKTTAPASNRAPDSATAWTVRPTKNYLTCSPQAVGPADVLTLRMQRPHGSSLYVGAPDGTPYIVVFHGQGDKDRGARRSRMSPGAFEQLTALRLAVGTLTGGVWIFGRDTNEVVFRVPGTYRVRVGTDMETDGPDYAECLVTYRPS